MARFIYIIFTVLAFSPVINAQGSWESRVWSFGDSIKKYSTYRDAELKGMMHNADVLIGSFCDSCSKSALAYVFITKADIAEELLERKHRLASDEYLFSLEYEKLISEIESYYRKAMLNDSACKCEMLYKLREFYSTYGNHEQSDRAYQEAKKEGVPMDYFSIGADFNYVAPNNLVSVELGILDAWTIRQPKKGIRPDGSKYRKCKYSYPQAYGGLFIGYETSLTNIDYRALKVNPIWFKSYLSLHPLQFLFANDGHKKSFVYRPEVGFSFSTFAIDYAINLPTNNSFTYLARHNLSIRICIPTIPFDN